VSQRRAKEISPQALDHNQEKTRGAAERYMRKEDLAKKQHQKERHKSQESNAEDPADKAKKIRHFRSSTRVPKSARSRTGSSRTLFSTLPVLRNECFEFCQLESRA